MSLIGYVIAFTIGFVVILLLGYFKKKAFTPIIIISAVLAGFSVSLAAHLKYSVSATIEAKELITKQEKIIIKKLELIREAEIVYQEINGNYTSDWDKLINFIKNGKYPIIQRKEIVVTLSYGADSSIIKLDTLGIISARERIFYETYNINAANNGDFDGFVVKVGDHVEKGSNAYSLIQDGKKVFHKFRQSGTITKLVKVTKGQKVTKGDYLLTLRENKHDINTNIDRIGYVPGYDDVKFDIYADEVDKSGVFVDVIEVKNPKPFNPDRNEKNEARNRKPLRFGSKTDVTTSGNWE